MYVYINIICMGRTYFCAYIYMCNTVAHCSDARARNSREPESHGSKCSKFACMASPVQGTGQACCRAERYSLRSPLVTLCLYCTEPAHNEDSSSANLLWVYKCLASSVQGTGRTCCSAAIFTSHPTCRMYSSMSHACGQTSTCAIEKRTYVHLD
jgi:hypothetical protein